MIVPGKALAWVLRSPMPGVSTVIVVHDVVVGTAGVYKGKVNWNLRKFATVRTAHLEAVNQTDLRERDGAQLELEPQTIALLPEELKDLLRGRVGDSAGLDLLALRLVSLAKLGDTSA